MTEATNVSTETKADAAAKFPRWRRWTAGALVVISCVLVPLSVLAVWVRDQVLDTDRYVSNVTPLASNPTIIDTVATDITNALFNRVDVAQVAENALPERASFLGPPLAAGLRDVVMRAAVSALSSDQFETIWIAANRAAHEQLRKALTNQGKVVSTENGKVELDLSALVTQVRLALKQRGISIFDRIPADQLALKFELMDAKQLAKAQRGTKLLDQLSWILPVLVFVCLGGALLLTPNRRRTLLRWGIGAAVGSAFVGAGVAIGRQIYLDAVTSPSLPSDTAAIVFDTLVRFLRDGVRLLIAIGLLVALGAWLSGPSAAAMRVRATSRAVLGRAGDAAGGRGLRFGGFGTWVAAHRGALRVGSALLVLIVLLLWNHPRARTVLFLAVALLVLMAIIEFIARAASADTSPQITRGEVM